MSTDLFGDGSVVLVPLAEHGALGLFLTVADGRRFFFSGDTLGRATPADEAGSRSGFACRPPPASTRDGSNEGFAGDDRTLV